MYPVSDAFRAALAASSMVVATRATASDGTVLNVRGGSVSMDSGREIGRTCSLDLTAADGLTAEQVYALVTSPDIELTVQRGLVTEAGSELVPLGVFSTDTASIAKGVDGSVSWSGSDRSKKIARNRFIDPYVIEAGTPLATAGADLIRSRFAGAVVDFSNVTEAVGATIAFEAGDQSNPWKEARALVADYGYDLRFNGLGVAVAVEVGDPAQDDPAFDFGAGETSLVLDGSAETSLDGVYNGVIATGEGTDVQAPVRAVVWDTDQTSPTYYLGGFGQVPYFFSSPLITTEDQATKAARSVLARVKGRLQQIAWPAIVNPALEPLDIVTVTFGETTSRVVIDELTIPLDPGAPMSAKARQTAIQ